MKTTMKLLAGCALLCAGANALEFNEIGHKSKSMGGVGVAMRNNPYAVFYNPALTAASPATRLGYGVGLELNYKNVLDVFDYDFKNIKLSDIDKFNALLEENYLNAKGQGAFAFKIPDVLPFGQLSLGFSYTLYATANLTGKLLSNDASNDIFDLDKLIEDAKKSIPNLNIRRVDIIEVPLSYAIDEETAIGRVSVGAAFKFMNASSYAYNRKLTGSDDIGQLLDDIVKNSGATRDSNFGLDLGVVYSPMDFQSLNVALSAKNINAPKFKFGENGDLNIKPQVRLGLSYEILDSLIVAADMDLIANTLLETGGVGEKEQKSQKMGLGLDFDTTFFDVRAGVAKDLRQDNGVLLSFGLGFSVIDIGVVASTKSVEAEGKRYPRYVGFQIGGGFSF